MSWLFLRRFLEERRERKMMAMAGMTDKVERLSKFAIADWFRVLLNYPNPTFETSTDMSELIDLGLCEKMGNAYCLTRSGYKMVSRWGFE